MSKWQQHLCLSSEKLQSKGYPEGAAHQSAPDNAHCSQLQTSQSTRLFLVESELLCELKPVVLSFCEFHCYIQIPAAALAGEGHFLQNPFHLRPFPRPADLVIFSSTSLQQEPPPFSLDSFCHCFPALQTSLASAGCAIK